MPKGAGFLVKNKEVLRTEIMEGVQASTNCNDRTAGWIEEKRESGGIQEKCRSRQ